MTGLSTPYYRIFRPFSAGGNLVSAKFYIDPNFSKTRGNAVQSLLQIQSDLEKVFDYIAPYNGNNLSTFSIRLYELLFRICTEIECQFKGILVVNNYRPLPNAKGNIPKINMGLFPSVLESILKLSEYETEMFMHDGLPYNCKPFKNWHTVTPTWWTAYNNVKHDRDKNFSSANLENVMLAFSGLCCVLFSQYGINITHRSRSASSAYINNNMISLPELNITISPPLNWLDSEKYSCSIDCNTYTTIWP